VGPFTLADAHTLDDLAEKFSVVPIAEVARRSFPSCDLVEEDAASVRYGRKLRVDLGAAGPVAVFDPAGDFLALYEQRDDVAAPVAVFTS
jgi:tRNA pseudouridine55 synthase